MGFPFGLKKEFCKKLTRKGKCKAKIQEEKGCPYTKIPLPANDEPKNWQKTLEYIESISCPSYSEEIDKWLKKVRKKLQIKLNN